MGKMICECETFLYGEQCHSSYKLPGPLYATSEFYIVDEPWHRVGCNRREGHEGLHVACCTYHDMHDIAVWSTEEAVSG